MRSSHLERLRRHPVIVAVIAIVVAVSLLTAGCSSSNDSGGDGKSKVGSHGGKLGQRVGNQSVAIKVPPGGALNGTRVTFTHKPRSTYKQDVERIGIKPLGDPIDVTATRGKLKQGTITLSYDRKKLPPHVTARQVGILVYDEKIGAWFPLLDSKADPKTGLVSGTAPHFSVFQTFFVDPIKKQIKVAGHNIAVAFKDTMTVMRYFQEIITATASAIVEDLFAIAPEASCEDPSTTVHASTRSASDGAALLQACVDGTGKTASLHMSNLAAYPVLFDTLPPGVTVTAKDVIGGDVNTLVRNMYWMTKGRLVMGGAKAGSLTIKNKLAKSTTLHAHMDTTAVAFDMLLSVLLVFMPFLAEKATLDAILNEAAAASAAAIESGGKSMAAATTTAIKASAREPKTDGKLSFEDAFANVENGGNCIQLQRGTSDQANLHERLVNAVKRAQTCGAIVLDQFDGTKLIQGLLESLKIVPEAVEATISGINNGLTGGRYKLTSAYVTMTPIKPIKMNVGQLAGAWYNDQGWLIVNSDGTGEQHYDPTNDFYAKQPCNSTAAGCVMRFKIKKVSLVGTPANAVATVTGNNSHVMWPEGDTLYFNFITEDGRAIQVSNPAVTSGTDTYSNFCRKDIKSKCAMGSDLGMP